MSEVCAASAAEDFGALHAVGSVVSFGDGLWGDGLVVAGPSAAGFVFGVGIEEVLLAGDALVGAVFFVVVEFAGEGRFGAAAANDAVGFWAEFFFPLFFGFLDFEFHCWYSML